MRRTSYKIGDLVWYLDFKLSGAGDHTSRTIIVGVEEMEKRVFDSSATKHPLDIQEDWLIPIRPYSGPYRMEKYRYYRIMAGEQVVTVGEYEVWKHKKRLVNSLSYRLNETIRKSFAANYKPPNYNQIIFPQIAGILAAPPQMTTPSIVCTFEISGTTGTNGSGSITLTR